jgi:rhodanese-related sulfurtransferase
MEMKMTKCFNTLVTEAQQAVPAITVDEAHDLHHKGMAVFVDPRPAEAIASTTGIIPGAVNLSLDTIEAGTLPDGFKDRSMAVITSCQAGPMAAIAAHALAKLGFSDVRYIDGGTQAWLDAGHETRR